MIYKWKTPSMIMSVKQGSFRIINRRFTKTISRSKFLQDTQF